MKKTSRTIRTFVRSVIGIAFVLSILLIPAGTLFWPEAWIFFLLYVFYAGGIFLWMKRNNPGLLKERTSPKHNVKKWDRAILRSYTVCLVCMLACCGLDAVRFQWSNMPLWLRISGFLCLVPPAVIAFRVFKVNSFLSSVVRLQKDRAQKVVQAGPYRFVRHPLYTSVILMVIFTPLALGSFYALLISGLIIALFFLRTHLEDRTLKKELPGYKKYARKVRYRLIPGVW